MRWLEAPVRNNQSSRMVTLRLTWNRPAQSMLYVLFNGCGLLVFLFSGPYGPLPNTVCRFPCSNFLAVLDVFDVWPTVKNSDSVSLSLRRGLSHHTTLDDFVNDLRTNNL